VRLSGAAFRCLSLCAQRPGSAVVTQRLRAALAALPSAHELADAAEQHGLEPLVLAHVRAADVVLPPHIRDRLQARQVQHAHAAAVRTRVIGDVARAMEQARVPLLVLKGAALAQMVYGDPRLRPMRDVDLLARPSDVRRAQDVLARCGFQPGGVAVPRRHHHLEALSRTVDGATITIELHHHLLVGTPFVDALTYDDLAAEAQALHWGDMMFRTLGCEDMLWHVYAHVFVINTLRPGAIRLLSVADLVQATEAWIDRIDWGRVKRKYGRLLRALCVQQHLVPWSPHVAETLRAYVNDRAAAVVAHPIASDAEFSAALLPDILWPPEWWFRMRYGITGRRGWLWYRAVGHPARVFVSAARAVMTRLVQGVGSIVP
jgi:hypothetical protein